MDRKEAIGLLKRYSSSKKDLDKVLAHSLAVEKVAVKIAKQVNADVEFVRIASLLHDIGRFECPPHTKKSIKHGIVGSRILRKQGYEKLAKVAERHLGAGITKEDITKHKLPLPLKDLVPRTKEEKVVAYADNLIFGVRTGTMKDVIARYRKELGERSVRRIISLHNKLVDMGMRRKRI